MIQRERLALIGHPVSQSLSPTMHNAALEAVGSSVRYEALDVLPGDLPAILEEFSHTRCGGNFTIPHKKAAMQSMRVVSDVAHSVGAVNTFWSDGYGAIDGDNTDVVGFDKSIEEMLGQSPKEIRVAVLGAGGAAAAALTAIDRWPGTTASVHARDLARAMSMRMRHSAVIRACSMRDPCLADADLVVNATPIGMGSDELPVDLAQLKPGAAVFDMVYGRGETRFVREARESGRNAMDGLRMLLHQGVAAFILWFGEEPPAEVMWRALREAAGRS